jgi:uncharacterized membrane protein
MTLRILGAIGITVLLASTTVLGDSTRYTFTTVDITVPDRPGSVVIPEDINDDGVIVSSISSGSWGAEGLVANPTRRQGAPYVTSPFNCAGVALADASAFSVNDKADVVGYCTAQRNGPRVSAFVRDRNGKRALLDFPGADHTLAFGISSARQVVGHYVNPFAAGQPALGRTHGFSWVNGKFETIDFPLANTYTNLWRANRQGRIIGDYYRFDAGNALLEHNWFLYDNGQFKLDFPPSLEWMGGPGVTLSDINDGGQIVGFRHSGGPGWDGLFVYNDGILSDIAVPPEYAFVDVRGINNKGQFVGAYFVQVGVDPTQPVFEIHGYVATPVVER